MADFQIHWNQDGSAEVAGPGGVTLHLTPEQAAQAQANRAGIPNGAKPGPTPGSWVDSSGAIHYPAADTSGYGQIGAAFDQRPIDILNGMDTSTREAQAGITAATNAGTANLTAAANAANAGGTQILNNAYGSAANQAAQGQTGLEQAASLANYNTALGERAMGGLGALADQATQASANYGAQGDQLLQQQQALQNTGIQQLLAAQAQNQGDVNNLYGYAARGAGPSAAEAQLALARDQAQADAISLANSGRGVGALAANMRQAQAINAATQQQSAMQMAQLRAQEEQAWRQQQLQAIAGAGQLGLQGNQFGQQAWQNYMQQAGQAASGAGQLGSTYAGLSKDLYGQGIQAQQGYNQLANSSLGTGLNYNQGMASNANQATATGVQGYNNLVSQGNQLTGQGANLGFQGAQQNASFGQANTANKNNLYSTQLQSDTQRYGANAGVGINSANNAAQQQAALVGTIGTIAGAAALAASDVRMKTNIQPLEERLAMIKKFRGNK